MSNMVNVTKALAPGMVIVDMETGTVIGTNVRLVFLDTTAEDRILSSDSEARAYATSRGTDLYADLDADDMTRIAERALTI